MKSSRLGFAALAVCISLAVFTPGVLAADKWINLASKHFNVVSNAGERETRELALKLEQFRYLVSKIRNTGTVSPVPLTVVVFKGDGSFKPFKPLYNGKPANVAGYFQRGEDENLIALNIAANELRPLDTIYHEYTHLLTGYTRRRLPTWLAEGIAENRIIVTGNTAVDALLLMHRRVSAVGQAERIENSEGFPRFATRSGDRLVLVTAHRRESFGEGIRSICAAIRTLSERHADWQFLFPVHPNPNVDGVVRPLLQGRSNVHLTAPLNYEEFVYAMGRSSLILTDSGGIQEEAPSLGKPVVLLREVTERVEAVESGNVIVAGLAAERIVEAAERLVSDEALGARIRAGKNPYGDGMASRRIIDHLLRVL